MKRRPNIVLFVPHDLGAHLHCYGQSSVASPNLDALAEQGVLFTSHFCASTPCSPARGCLMTGRYAHENGLMGLVNHGWNLPGFQRTLVDYLNDAGYLTFCCGGQHERLNPEDNRYRHLYVPPGLPLCDHVYPQAIEFITSRKDEAEPFFMSIFTLETHLPHAAADLRMLGISDHIPRWPVHKPRRVNVPPWLVDAPGSRRGLAKFNGQIEFYDGWVGRLLAAIRESGLDDDTVVIFTTDHGIAFPGAKGMLSDPGTRISLIMRFPDSWGIEPRQVDALTTNIDILPTVLEMVGAGTTDPACGQLPGAGTANAAGGQVPEPETPKPEPPAGATAIRGCSLWPGIAGGSFPADREIYLEKNYHDCYDPKRAVRTGRYKYIRNFAAGPKVTLASDIALSDAGRVPSFDTILDRPEEELYDLEADQWERQNLAGSGTHEAVLDDLRQKLRSWMAETGDPLLSVGDGAVIPYPPGQWM